MKPLLDNAGHDRREEQAQHHAGVEQAVLDYLAHPARPRHYGPHRPARRVPPAAPSLFPVATDAARRKSGR
jgi:hypothetical protein